MPHETDNEQYMTPELEALVSAQEDTRALLEELRNKLSPVTLQRVIEDQVGKDPVPVESRCDLRHTIRLAGDRQGVLNSNLREIIREIDL